MLEIRLNNMLLVMTEAELMKCLLRMPYTLEAAIKRGKSVARPLKEDERKGCAE